MEKEIYKKPLWCDPPTGWRYGFPKVYDANKHPDFYKWITDEGYPQSEIDRYGKEFYCRWWETEEE